MPADRASQARDEPLNDITNQTNGEHPETPAPMEGVDDLEGIDPKLLKISHEHYQHIANMLVVYVREEEERHSDDEDWEGVRQSQLTEWFVTKTE